MGRFKAILSWVHPSLLYTKRNEQDAGRVALQEETPLRVGTIGGAALLSLGVVTLGIVLKERLKWKRELRKYKEG